MIVLGLALQARAADLTERTLGEHTFVVPAQVDSPFASSRFALSQGVGYLTIPNVRVDGYPTPVDLHLAGLTETLEASARFAGDNAVFAELSANVTAGVNADTAFLRGAEGGLAAELGARRVVWRPTPGRFALGLRSVVRYRQGYDLEPSNVVAALLERREETLGAVLRGDYLRYLLANERSGGLGAGVSAAWALHPHLGLQASALLLGGSRRRQAYDLTLDRQVIETGPFLAAAGGVALDWDLAPAAPVGLQLELRTREDGELFGRRDVLARNFIALGASYSGEPNLQLGLMWTLLLVGPNTERFQTGEFVFRTFF